MSYLKTKTSDKEDRLDLYARWHARAKPYFLWQLEQFKPYLGESVLDVGCGIGNFTEILMDKKRYIGIDYDSKMIEEMRVQYAGKNNVKFIQADVTNQEEMGRLKDKEPDSILCVNVLEHIENDIVALNNMLAILPPNGHLCIIVPAFQFLYGTLDSLDGHFRRYNKRLLSDKLNNLPGRLVRQYYFNMIGSLGWFLKGKIFREKTQSDANYEIMNLLIPIFSKMERVFQPPFGMSLVTILRKHL